MKKYLLITFFILINVQILSEQNVPLYANEYLDSSQLIYYKHNIRTLFFFSSVGILEIFSIGLGYQVTEHWSVSLKGSLTGFEGGFLLSNSAGGYGAKVAYHFNQVFIFNKASIEYTGHLSANIDYAGLYIDEPFYKGSFVDINIGYEKVIERGINFWWSIGYCINDVKYAKTLYWPSIKTGINYSFL